MRPLAILALSLLAGCAANPPALSSAQLHARTADVAPLAVHPPGVVSSFPPGDPSAAPLRCHGGGENTVVCDRDSESQP
jgi:hypothetical protein